MAWQGGPVCHLPPVGTWQPHPLHGPPSTRGAALETSETRVQGPSGRQLPLKGPLLSSLRDQDSGGETSRGKGFPRCGGSELRIPPSRVIGRKRVWGATRGRRPPLSAVQRPARRQATGDHRAARLSPNRVHWGAPRLPSGGQDSRRTESRPSAWFRSPKQRNPFTNPRCLISFEKIRYSGFCIR